MAKIDDITVRICDEDRQRLGQLAESIGWLREHLEEIRTFAQTPATSISSASGAVTYWTKTICALATDCACDDKPGD